MIALLGLLAVAGYQNRDKLSALLQGTGDPDRDGINPGGRRYSETAPATGGGLVDNLRGMFAGAGSGGVARGLSEMLDRFANPVQAAKAQSWVETGPNGTLAPADLKEVLDEDTLADLTQKTGLSRSELLIRLSEVLPEAVDQFTPDGRMPPADAARGLA